MPTVYLATRRMHAGAGPGDSEVGMAAGRAGPSTWSVRTLPKCADQVTSSGITARRTTLPKCAAQVVLAHHVSDQRPRNSAG